MNRNKIEDKVRNSFINATPDIYGDIERDVSNLDVDRSRSAARRTASKSLFWKLASGVLSLVLIVMAVVGVVTNVNQTAQAATVSLDVNPSVEIVLNRNNRVVTVNALNTDGEIIISDMDFSGCQLKVAVNALIGSMLRAGYLSDLANSVLVSVDTDKNNYQSIAELVADEIALTLKQGQIEASVVSQWIQNDDEITAIAKQYGISQGKAQLISKIVAKTDYTVEQLAELSVNELSLLLPNIDIDDGDVEQSGSASAKEYIDRDKALTEALNVSGIEGLTVETEGLTVRKNKLDFDDGEMVYDVAYVYGDYEYNVEVGAISGKIVAYQKSLNSHYSPDETNVVIADREAAKAFVLGLAGEGLSEESVTNLYAEQMWYFRGTVYEVFFQTNDRFYQYCVGSDGTVIEEYYEMITLSAEDSYLRREHVVDWFIENNTDGFTRMDVLNGRMRVSSEKTVDGRLVYELSFVSNGNRYVYKIDAVSKTIDLSEVTEYESGSNNSQGGDRFPHGGDWFWDDWYRDDDFDDFDDFDDRNDHRGERPQERPYSFKN